MIGNLGAEKAAEFLSSCEIQSVYSSPLRRARRTAEIIVSRLGGRYFVKRAVCSLGLLPYGERKTGI